MLNIFLLVFSCAKHQVIDHNAARTILNNQNCLETIQQQIEVTDCPTVKFTRATPYDVMFRCDKDDSERGEFWDNYIFRISPADIKYVSADDYFLIQRHTICLDDKDRVEAYPPAPIINYN